MGAHHPATLPIEQAPVSLERRSEAVAMVEMIERLAPTVDVDKLERLIALQERGLARAAEEAFNAAFIRLLRDVPTIIERARTDKTAYAPLEDIIEPLRPILAQHQFSLSFRTEWPDPKLVKVIGILTHAEGHARTSEFLSAADQTGSKNAIQALGSTVTYGKRYVTKDLLCIVTREEDDDGSASETREQPEAPEGFQDWLDNLTAAADEGWDQFKKAWNPEAVTPFREHLARSKPGHADKLKAKAQKVSREARS